MLSERLQSITSTRLLVLLRGFTPDEILPLARALAAGGVRAIEVTLDSPGSLESIRVLRQVGGPKLLVGAGTVLDSGAAERALRAGAQLLVTPGLAQDVASVAREERVPVIMGALTPSEVLAAHRAGSTMVKVFPATLFGPEYVRHLRGPLGHVPLLCSGGITAGNAGGYLAAGATAVGVGDFLVTRDAVVHCDWSGLTTRAQALMEIIGGDGLIPAAGG